MLNGNGSIRGTFDGVNNRRMLNNTEVTQLIKTTSSSLGFSFCGVSRAEFLEEEAPLLEQWLGKGHQGQMRYLENHFDERLDPRKLVPGARSVISLGYNYYPTKDLSRKGAFKIAKYAYGEDYHFVVKAKLKELWKLVEEKAGAFEGRIFVDSAPVMERAWARRSGMGWIGKNSLLLNRSMGSFFFLAEWIVNRELDYDGPVQDYCGSCTACMDACPTDAIPSPYVVDGSKCISYFTIELRDEIPAGVKGKFDDWMFGCDICQDVCPWNRFSQPHQEPRFTPPDELMVMTKDDWRDLTEPAFQKVFRKSPLKRVKYEGLKRTIRFLD